MDESDDATFCKALPKTELHAHLTGSILPAVLQEIWLEHKEQNPELELGDPVEVLETARERMDANSFFPLFSKFIYRLCNNKRHIQKCTKSVLKGFRDDGVQYLELRTIPRSTEDLTKEEYVQTVLDILHAYEDGPSTTYLILGVDRKNTIDEAIDTVDLAIKYKSQGVVAVDLAGNPSKHDVSIFAVAYQKARDAGLKVTLHFAEVSSSSHDQELRALLDYSPDRLGHVINVPDWAKNEIRERKIGLELCLTCNVDAKLIEGGYSAHHFGYWKDQGCPIAICTDDVGVFRSTTSNEYRLLMEHFKLSRKDIVQLSRGSVGCIFGTDTDREKILSALQEFESSVRL